VGEVGVARVAGGGGRLQIRYFTPSCFASSGCNLKEFISTLEEMMPF
jgi:hypothetical protein